MDDHGSLYWIGHVASGSAILATMAGIFPPMAALVAAIFYCVQLYESKTVQKWRHNRKQRKIARLRAEIFKLTGHDKDNH
jgi:chromate transport protein ChrA